VPLVFHRPMARQDNRQPLGLVLRNARPCERVAVVQFNQGRLAAGEAPKPWRSSAMPWSGSRWERLQNLGNPEPRQGPQLVQEAWQQSLPICRWPSARLVVPR